MARRAPYRGRRGVGSASLSRVARRRIEAFMAALLLALVAQFTTLDSAIASFAALLGAGPQALRAATLATPVGVASANGGCAGGNEKTNVSVTWSASAEVDADGSQLVNGYTVLRSTSSGGSYSSVGDHRRCDELHRRQPVRSGDPAGLRREQR